MAKKVKRRPPLVLSADELKRKVEKALGEGRSQQALELARQLHRDEPTAPHKALLLKATLERARHLRSQGHTRDARTVLDNLLPLAGDDPAWLAPAAEELAACGYAAEALRLMDRLPEGPGRAAVQAAAVDAALAQGPAGRSSLPETLQPAFDLVVQAFAQAQAGQDEAARQALQGIGLSSPFLEWKLLLRGLLAYYANDDARALENWSRLNPQRIPARLAAPLRFRVDAAFRVAQPPETQTLLQRQADQLQGSGLIQPLRMIQGALAGEELEHAFRLATNVLPALRRDSPSLVPRLASCFYWAIIHLGNPSDVQRYRRLFGAPADDPDFARLEALATEERGDLENAHKYWQSFEKSVAAHPEAWPAGQADAVRALVWCHMGQNADSVPDAELLKRLPAHLREFPGRPKPLKPSAEDCFRKSLALAPEQLEAHEALFQHYLHHKKEGKAVKAGQKLLERFPDHAETLDALGQLCLDRGDHAEGLALYQRALKVNPLDRSLRGKVSYAHSRLARSHADAGRFGEARVEYQAALAFQEGNDHSGILVKWAACEFRAANPERAEELLRQALQQAGHPLPVAYGMVIEVARCKLPKPLKTRFDQEFVAALAAPSTAAAVLTALGIAASHHSQVKYTGQKTHEKKVLAYLKKVPTDQFTEDQLERICNALLHLNELTQLRRWAGIGKRCFPRSPHFPFLEAQSHMLGRKRPPYWKVIPLLNSAEMLAQQMPADDRQKDLLDLIRVEKMHLGPTNIFGGLGGGLFGNFELPFELDGPFDDDDDADDDSW